MSNVIEIKNIKQSITDSGLDVIYEICVNNNFFSINYQISGAWGIIKWLSIAIVL